MRPPDGGGGAHKLGGGGLQPPPDGVVGGGGARAAHAAAGGGGGEGGSGAAAAAGAAVEAAAAAARARLLQEALRRHHHHRPLLLLLLLLLLRVPLLFLPGTAAGEAPVEPQVRLGLRLLKLVLELKQMELGLREALLGQLVEQVVVVGMVRVERGPGLLLLLLLGLLGLGRHPAEARPPFPDQWRVRGGRGEARGEGGRWACGERRWGGLLLPVLIYPATTTTPATHVSPTA